MNKIVVSADDKSDQKSLNNLVEYLKKLEQSSFPSKQTVHNKSSSKMTSVSLKSNKNKCLSAKRKRNRMDEKQPKISDFVVKKESGKKVKPLDVQVSKNEKKIAKLVRSPSFEKYGVELPSFDKIMEDQKKLEEYKKKVEAFELLDYSILERKIDTSCLKGPKEFTGEVLGCKHVSLDKLKEAFDRHVENLKDIMSGKTYCERHELFHNYKVKYNFTTKDLKCSASLMVFTQEQIDYLLKLMGEEMDPEDLKLDYFFKVLLPEVCLMIFMDIHNMERKKAIKYLEERPIDDHY